MNRSLVPRLLLLPAAIILATPSYSFAQSTAPSTWTAGSGSSAVDFELRLDGSIVEKGAGTSTLANSELELSSRFLWYPVMSALRAGGGTSTETVANVGQYSTAFGLGNIASGTSSIAWGNNATASGQYATAGGINVVSSGWGSVAIGDNVTALNLGTAAIGYNAVASGYFSTAVGNILQATGYSSTALGCSSTATGYYSVAIGAAALATGYNSVAMGSTVKANSYSSCVVGYNNAGLSETGVTPSLTSWVSTDPLFEVGYGSSSNDALVIYKDGNAKFVGAVSVPQSGDIPMYTGN